jgi:hypothetical protein
MAISKSIQAAAFALITSMSLSANAGVIDKLSAELTSVRKLPDGERPVPKVDDLSGLTGRSKAEILQKLGGPDSCESESEATQKCDDAYTWTYTWGPSRQEQKQQDLKIADGNEIVFVSTGGPWLLILNFKNRKVVRANWLGQK